MEHFSYTEKVRHKLFISYFHRDDEPYRREFERQFGHRFTPKSVNLGDIATELSDEYVKRLIRENYVRDTSVIVVLVGSNTKFRKHVDWEISAGLEPSKGRSGLLAVLLPSIPLRRGRFDYDHLPPRLADNLQSDYAIACTWNQIDSNIVALDNLVNTAFGRRLDGHLARNSRPQMQINTGP